MFERDPDNADQRRMFTRRALIFGAAQAGAGTVIASRLWHLQVEEHGRFGLLADENRINVQFIAPERGRILDRFGTLLAANQESYRAVLVPSLAFDVKGVLARFAKLVPLSTEEQYRLAVRATKQSPNLPLIIAPDLTFEQIAVIGLQSPHLPGIATEAAPKRQYFHGSTVGHVVGYIGAIERLAMDDEPLLRLPGMRSGKTGIERGRETALRGTGGVVQSEVDSRGRIVRHLDRVEPAVGRDIVSTIDTALQREVLGVLAPFRRAAAVVMDVEGGEVLALGSVPLFDPNDILRGAGPRGIQRLKASLDDPMNNRATRGLYPPGSTFKMVTALAAAESGVIDLKEKIACDGRYDYFDQTFRCWKRSGHGACDFHSAIKQSCDCYFYEIVRRTGIDALAAMARKLGFGQVYDCGLAGLKRGLVPDPDWKRGRFGKAWVGGETILAGIGQGFVLTTPLQLTVMMARIGSGRMVTPTFVRRGPDEPVPVFAPIAGRPEWISAIRRGLTSVVNDDGGTGAKARPEEGSFVVAGKTGTSQVGRASSETAQLDLPWELRDHALFVSYAPAAKPRYAVTVVVEHGGGGGATAAPLAREILEKTMARDPIAKPAWQGAPATGERRAPADSRAG